MVEALVVELLDCGGVCFAGAGAEVGGRAPQRVGPEVVVGEAPAVAQERPVELQDVAAADGAHDCVRGGEGGCRRAVLGGGRVGGKEGGWLTFGNCLINSHFIQLELELR